MNSGSAGLAKQAIANGADINDACWGGRARLHDAVESGNLAMAKLLVSAGADPDMKLPNRLTPFEFAVKINKTEIVEYFSSLRK